MPRSPEGGSFDPENTPPLTPEQKKRMEQGYMAPGERIEGDDTSPFDEPPSVKERLKEMREKNAEASKKAQEKSVRKAIEDALEKKAKDEGTDFEITVDDSPDKTT